MRMKSSSPYGLRSVATCSTERWSVGKKVREMQAKIINCLIRPGLEPETFSVLD